MDISQKNKEGNICADDMAAASKSFAAGKEILAVDEALEVLRTFGLTRALVDGGGDVVLGDPPPGMRGWRVELSAVTADGDLVQQEHLLAALENGQAVETPPVRRRGHAERDRGTLHALQRSGDPERVLGRRTPAGRILVDRAVETLTDEDPLRALRHLLQVERPDLRRPGPRWSGYFE